MEKSDRGFDGGNEIHATNYVYKTTSVGFSMMLSGYEPHQAFHFFDKVDALPAEVVRQGYCAMLVGKVISVFNPKYPFLDLNQPLNIPVIDERVSYVVGLDASVFCIFIRQEGNAVEADFSGRYVDKFAITGLPDGVEFSFYQDSFSFPDSPTNYSSATVFTDVIWHDAKAFTDWFVGEWLAQNRDWAFDFIDGLTKVNSSLPV
jgi:hypothetical protein